MHESSPDMAPENQDVRMRGFSSRKTVEEALQSVNDESPLYRLSLKQGFEMPYKKERLIRFHKHEVIIGS